MSEKVDLWKVVKRHVETITEDGTKKVVLKKVDLLLQRVSELNPDINCTDTDDFTLVTYAAYYNNVELLQKLIDQGADINLLDKNGWSPIMYTVQDGHKESFDLLKNSNADLNKTSNDGWNITRLAERFNTTNVLE